MTIPLEEIKEAIIKTSQDERRLLRRFIQTLAPHELEARWGVQADVILDALEKSSDLTKRGMRGILAEAIFESEVVPTLGGEWRAAAINRNEDLPYDSLLENGKETVRVQVKLQRSIKGGPMLFHPKHYEKGSLYVVEVQKTRTGTKTKKEKLPDSDEIVSVSAGVTENTRPYRFGQFDILAVNMHPSVGDWKSFRYTVGSWLLPRTDNPDLIAVLQPVSSVPNEVWTDSLGTCLEWLRNGEIMRVLNDMKHLRIPGQKNNKAK